MIDRVICCGFIVPILFAIVSIFIDMIFGVATSQTSWAESFCWINWTHRTNVFGLLSEVTLEIVYELTFFVWTLFTSIWTVVKWSTQIRFSVDSEWKGSSLKNIFELTFTRTGENRLCCLLIEYNYFTQMTNESLTLFCPFIIFLYSRLLRRFFFCGGCSPPPFSAFSTVLDSAFSSEHVPPSVLLSFTFFGIMYLFVERIPIFIQHFTSMDMIITCSCRLTQA